MLQHIALGAVHEWRERSWEIGQLYAIPVRVEQEELGHRVPWHLTGRGRARFRVRVTVTVTAAGTVIVTFLVTGTSPVTITVQARLNDQSSD